MYPFSLTPGPTPIPDFIQKILSQGVIYHRSEEFKILYAQNRTLFQQLFLTQNRILTLTGSGTYAMEFALANLNPKEVILGVSFGKFSQRWLDIAQQYGRKIYEVSAPWGEAPSTQAILTALEQAPDVSVLCLTHSETSTGTRLDIERIIYEAKLLRPNLLVLVDGITSVGAMPLYTDNWGIDMVFTSSQKALGCPPGVSFCAVSETYLQRAVSAGYAFNLDKYLKSDDKNLTPFTPATLEIMAVNASLKYILTHSLPTWWNEKHQLAQFTRKKGQEIGLNLWSQQPCDSLTAFRLPTHITASDLTQYLQKEHNILIGKGQGEFKEQIIRISHLGYTPQSITDQALKGISTFLGVG